MATGKVKWFNQEKGYGFISTEEGGDLFVHHNSIQDAGFQTLKEGAEVTFKIQQGAKGLEAIEVVMAGPHGGGGGLDD